MSVDLGPAFPDVRKYIRLGSAFGETAARFEHMARRYHLLYRTKRGQHRHKGTWQDCTTLICEENIAFLAYLLKEKVKP